MIGLLKRGWRTNTSTRILLKLFQVSLLPSPFSDCSCPKEPAAVEDAASTTLEDLAIPGEYAS